MNTQSDAGGHRTLSEEELEGVLREHERWVDTNGKEGTRADLSGADLKGVSLVGACLNSADLAHADLTGADLTEANLWRANLRNADLSGTDGLRVQALGQANTSNATLPGHVEQFDGLNRVRNASQYARTLFFTILVACVYSWLAVGTTSDPELITNSVTSPLPIIGTDLPIVGFYFVTPLVLLGLYVYFHLQLQRLWEELTMLPSVFPDGQPLDKKADPWLLIGKVRAYFAFLKNEDLPFFSLQKAAVNFVAWWIVPLTIFVFTYAYLPKHDLIGTGFHLLLSIGAMWLGVSFFQKAELTMRGKSRVPFGGREVWKTWRVFPVIPSLLGTVTWVLLAALGLTWTPGADVEQADLRGANLATAFLQNGQFREADLRHADLTDARLRKAHLTAARLDSADLQKANLTDAILKEAGLRHAVLDSAVLDSAALIGADLAGANLKEARLQNADLRTAKFSSTTLDLDNCKHEDEAEQANLQNANLSGANLRRAQLPCVHMETSTLKQANLRYANLEGAKLTGADITAANLENAVLRDTYLQGSNLRRGELGTGETHLERATLVGANLTKARLDSALLVEANLIDADLEDADLRKANLSEAVLLEADLRGADLRGADLRRAGLRGADLRGAELRGAAVTSESLCTVDMLENARLDDGTTASMCGVCPEKFGPSEEYEVGDPRRCGR